MQRVCRVVYERWLLAEVMNRTISLSPGMQLDDSMNAQFRGPATPWIDPMKEIQADAMAVEKGFASQEQIQIKRGAPRELMRERRQPAPVAPPAQLSLVPTDEEESAA